MIASGLTESLRTGLNWNACWFNRSFRRDAKISKIAALRFAERAADEFSEHYYAADPEDSDEDRFWYIRDLEDDDAPHVPVAISYEPRLSHFDSIEDIADHLADSPEYRALSNRIVAVHAGGGIAMARHAEASTLLRELSQMGSYGRARAKTMIVFPRRFIPLQNMRELLIPMLFW